MAPLPENNTPVLFIDYTAGGQAHSAEIRAGLTATNADGVAMFNAMKTSLLALMLPTDSITGARWRAAGSNLSFPLAVTGGSGTGTGTLDPDAKPNYLSYTGRSGDGRRVRFTFFSPLINPLVDGWRDATPAATAAAIRTALTGETVSARTISGLAPIWNAYVNFGSNSYYQRKTRRTDSK